MAANGQSRKDANRAIRQESLREQLSNQKHIEKVIDNIGEMEELDFFVKGDNNEIDYKLCQAKKFKLDALSKATEYRLKLINKYLPDLKAMELTGEGGGAVTFEEWVKSLEK